MSKSEWDKVYAERGPTCPKCKHWGRFDRGAQVNTLICPQCYERFVYLPAPEAQVFTDEARKALEGKMADLVYNDKAVRDVEGKDPYHLIPAVPLHEFVKVLANGGKKYGPRNWEKGMPYSWVWGSMMRHAWAFWRGEKCDPESGLHHMAHVAFGAFAFIEYDHTQKGDDDRPNVGTVEGVVATNVLPPKFGKPHYVVNEDSNGLWVRRWRDKNNGAFLFGKGYGITVTLMKSFLKWLGLEIHEEKDTLGGRVNEDSCI